MARTTSILLGDHFDSFVSQQVESGRFASASDVVQAALRLFELREKQKSGLIKALEKGENCGFVRKMDRKRFVDGLRNKYAK